MRKFLIGVVLVVACRKAEQPATGTVAAKPPVKTERVATMPAYEATRLDGTPFKLGHDKVVLLNVWATWCGPCRFEIPELQGLHDKYAARGFEVIGASVDEGDPKVVQDFVTEQKMTYPIILDPAGKIAAILDASVLPTTVLLDKSGHIVWKKIGAIAPQDAELAKAIEKAL